MPTPDLLPALVPTDIGGSSPIPPLVPPSLTITSGVTAHGGVPTANAGAFNHA